MRAKDANKAGQKNIDNRKSFTYSIIKIIRLLTNNNELGIIGVMSELKSNFFKGILYTGIARYSGIIIGIVISAILARLLNPTDFGVVAIATIAINFFSILTTVGISPAIVQNKTINGEELKSINTFTLILACVVTLLYLSIIPILTKFYDGHTQLRNVMLLLGINVFFSIASIVPSAMVMKDKLFKFIAVRTLVVQIVCGIISIIGAVYGLGVYSLLINPIGTAVFLLVVNFYKYPIKYSFNGMDKAVKKILNFSIYQSLFNLVYLAYRNIDKIVISHWWGLDTLGYYEKSYRLMMLPLENVSTVITPVLHPLLSDHQNDLQKVWNAYLKMIRFLSEFSFGLSVYLYFSAKYLILVLYGDKWEPAVSIFEILSISVCFQLLQAPIGAVLQSINKVKAMFLGGVWILLILCVLLPISIFTGYANGVPVAVLTAFAIGFFAYQYYIAKYFEKHLNDILNILKVHALYASLLGLLLWGLMELIRIESPIINLLLITVITSLYYMHLLYKGCLPEMSDLIHSGLSKLKK